jgi:hypothetical protein
VFEAELEYFIANQEELVSRYRGQSLVIRGSELVGVYSSPLDAYLAARRSYPAGTFMIQPCEPGPDAYTVTINAPPSASGAVVAAG